MSKTETIDEIVNLIKNLILKNEDRKETSLHSMIINEVGKKWSKDKGLYTEKFSDYGIDFVGRQKNYGKITLTMEVDQGHRAQRSWNKLADIRSENKMWVYVTEKPTTQAERFFRTALNDIRRFVEFRGEDASSFGKFVAILKTPESFKLESIFS